MGLINLLAYNYGRYAYFKTVEGACYESLTRPQCESKEWRITMETLLIVLVVYYFIDRWWRDRAMKKMINEGVKLFEILADATDRIEQQLGTAELGLIHNEKKYGIDYSLDAEKYTSEYTSPIRPALCISVSRDLLMSTSSRELIGPKSNENACSWPV